MRQAERLYRQSATHFSLTFFIRSQTEVAGELVISIPYLRHLAASRDKVDSLLRFGTTAWNGIDGGPAYGYGNIAIILARPPFRPDVPRQPGDPMPWEYIKPPADRAHAVPVAYGGSDIDGNLSTFYCSGRGIKGAFWANYLSAVPVALAGGEQTLRTRLAGMRVDPLNHGGLLIVATESPLPADTEENRARFLRLTEVLRPAFLLREEPPEIKRPMLGYFFRERSSVVP